MKALSMLFIVWGHLFPDRMTNFLYAFNVPVFFVISGFLQKDKGRCRKGYIVAALKSLLLPYVVICSTYLILNSFFLYQAGDLTVANYLRSIIYIFAGFQSCPHGIGSSAMWFVYTLLIIKIVFYVIDDWRWLGVIAVLCLCGTMFSKGHPLVWSVQNVLISFPFFYLGWLLANKEEAWFNKITNGIKLNTEQFRIVTIMLVVLGLFVVYRIGEHNGLAKMYECQFGNSLGLFLTGGVLGTVVVYLISLSLDSLTFPWVKTLSVGSIVILGYQYYPIKVYGLVMMIDKLAPYKHNGFLTLVYSFLVMWLFVFVIKVVQRHFPIILGGRKVE